MLRATASVPDDDRCRVPQQAGPQPLPETRGPAALVGARQLPRSEIEERHDERQAGRERDRPAGGVVDGAGGAATFGSPRRPEARPGQQERIDRERAGAEEPRRRQQSTPDDLEPGEALGRVVGVGREQERERLATGRVGVVGGQQGAQVLRRQRRALRLLERAGVEDDADAGRCVRTRGAEPRVAESRGGRRGHPPLRAGTSSAGHVERGHVAD